MMQVQKAISKKKCHHLKSEHPLDCLKSFQKPMQLVLKTVHVQVKPVRLVQGLHKLVTNPLSSVTLNDRTILDLMVCAAAFNLLCLILLYGQFGSPSQGSLKF